MGKLKSHNTGHTAAFPAPAAAGSKLRKTEPLTPVKFPTCTPQATQQGLREETIPLVELLQTIQRPADVKESHFEALGLHVIPNALIQDILPDSSYLPPFEEWQAVAPENLEQATAASKKPLNNGNLSPGVQTYQERHKELSIDNAAAFRTIRRLPTPAGESPVRLGNAYEFFKNLEFFSGYWHDTSLGPPPPPTPPSPEESDAGKENHPLKRKASPSPSSPQSKPALGSQQTQNRAGTGSQLPAEYRQHLLTAFIKLVAYDFGCNVSFPRCEPRLHITPSAAHNSKAAPKPPSHFSSACTFIYRTPSDRAAARSGIIEGPVATLSCRSATGFTDPTEQKLDLAREVIAILLTAQQRAREHATEKRFGEGKWWTEKRRWGGGPGGPIGREAERVNGTASPPRSTPAPAPTSPVPTTPSNPAVAAATKAVSAAASAASAAASAAAASTPDEDSIAVPDVHALKRILASSPLSTKTPSRPPTHHPSSPISPSSGTSTNTNTSGAASPTGSLARKKKLREGTQQIYDNYRKMLPPSSTWDRRARYLAIGKVRSSSSSTSGDLDPTGTKSGNGNVSGSYDDIFLLSSLNHHICIIRARVPDSLLDILAGKASGLANDSENGQVPRDLLPLWRSQWYDLFLVRERIQAMEMVWGIMAWLMRAVDTDVEERETENKEKREEEKGVGMGQSTEGVVGVKNGNVAKEGHGREGDEMDLS